VERTKGVRDPYLGPRSNYQKCFAMMQKALANPEDAAALADLYSAGMRNHLGQAFHGEFKANRATGELRNLLQQYEDLMSEWHDMQDEEGPPDVAGDPARRKQFMTDMTEGMRIAVRILALTKPK
jgi:type VI protein secretion system component VasF